jgi:L-iditol 2-dehydrogenase
MKRVLITGVRKAEVVEAPDPQPRENWVLVKVHTAPLCTEFKGFADGTGAHGYGHEAVGEVVAVAQPCRVRVGDRVVVQPGTPCGVCALCLAGDYIHCEQWRDFEKFTGGKEGQATLAQYVLKQDWLLSPLPGAVNYDNAGLALCGLGPAFGACELLRVGAFDAVLVTGLGPVGLGGVVNARYRGARVIGVDANEYRARLAAELGADVVLDPRDSGCLARIRELTGGKGADKAIECSGAPDAVRLCLDALRRKGELAFVGWGREAAGLVSGPDMIMKGLTLHGAWHYNLAAYPRVLDVIQKAPQVEKLITHLFPLRDIQKAWEIQLSGRCGKVLLKPWA